MANPQNSADRRVVAHTLLDGAEQRVAHALAHPLRRRLLLELRREIASPSQMAREMGIGLGIVSYHVRQLVGLGYLELVDVIEVRGGVRHTYRLAPRALNDCAVVLGPLLDRPTQH
jgi:DNA-binding transcriptional ArsR family regulator